MIVTCDNCGTKYNLPEAKIPASGAKVKCSKCAHVFKVAPPAPEPEPELEEDDLLAGLGDDLDETPSDGGGGADDFPDDESEDDGLPDDFPDDDGLDDLPDDLGGDGLDDLPDDDGLDDLPDEDEDDLDGLPDDFDDLPGGDDEPDDEEDDLDDLFGDDDDDMDDDLPFGDDDDEGEDDFEDDADEGDESDDAADDDLEDDEEYEDDDEFESGGTDLGLDGPMDKKKSKGGSGGLLKILIPVLVLVLLGGGVWYFKAWTFIPGLGGDEETAETAPATGDQAQGEAGGQASDQAGDQAGQAAPDAPPASSPAEQVKNIGLVKVRQFYVTNEKMTNKLFVIEGNAVNNFNIPKELIKVEATLYDGTGKVVARSAEVAGNTLSLFQLQVMTKEQISEALGSEVGILTNNTFLRPGMDVPFMLVFFDVPPSVKEFGVKVIEAKDPPKE